MEPTEARPSRCRSDAMAAVPNADFKTVRRVDIRTSVQKRGRINNTRGKHYRIYFSRRPMEVKTGMRKLLQRLTMSRITICEAVGTSATHRRLAKVRTPTETPITSIQLFPILSHLQHKQTTRKLDTRNLKRYTTWSRTDSKDFPKCRLSATCDLR